MNDACIYDRQYMFFMEYDFTQHIFFQEIINLRIMKSLYLEYGTGIGRRYIYILLNSNKILCRHILLELELEGGKIRKVVLNFRFRFVPNHFEGQTWF